MIEVPVNKRTRTRKRAQTSLLARGEAMMWLTGGALVICLVMIVGLLALVFFQGVGTFWPKEITQFEVADGRLFMGEITREERFSLSEALIATYPDAIAKRATQRFDRGSDEVRRRLVRTGNFDLANTHFHWVEDFAVTNENYPEWAIVAERRAWGRFYGFPRQFLLDGEPVAEKPEEIWRLFEQHLGEVAERFEQRVSLQKTDYGKVHARLEKARLDLRNVELDEGLESETYAAAKEEFDARIASIESEKQRVNAAIQELRKANDRYKIVMTTVDGQEATLSLTDIVRAYPANQLGALEKISIYFTRWWEFLTDDPREANSEGGVWPAIVGTVIMTLLMSVAVVPFGILAALYLREYAKAGPLVSAVRIAVNNLAGVPSIVFGVFGLGFFCYIVGASIDEVLFAAKLPNPTYGKGGVLWASLTLALLTLPVVIVATEESLAAVPGSLREGSYACGASKWQTVRRIVLPRAMPGIMTGLILAMARGAGEVAPLMLVGAVKLAPDLPLDSVTPFLHPERSFMHLGFHIYDVGFQSQNSEAAKPMVYTTTLLLITIIAALNVAAIAIRSRLRRKFVSDQF